MEKAFKLVPFKVKYFCDKCGKEVKFDNLVGFSNPPKYKHVCECGEEYWLEKQYPTIEFK